MKFVKLLLLMLIPILGFSQTLKVGDGVQIGMQLTMLNGLVI
jgi:hypothetical protein